MNGDSGWWNMMKWQFISSKLRRHLACLGYTIQLSVALLLPLAFHSKPKWHSLYTGERPQSPLDLIKPSISWNLTWQWTCLTVRHSSSINSVCWPFCWGRQQCAALAVAPAWKKNYSIWCRGCWMAKVEKANSLGVHVHMVSNKRSRLKIIIRYCISMHIHAYPLKFHLNIPFQDISFVSPFEYRGKL